MRVLALVLLVVAVGAAALPIDDQRRRADPTPGATRSAVPTRTPEPDVVRARCRAGVADCHVVRGTVMYVERVDPDGDGDLHVVVMDGSITAPGITAVDVRAGLRPARDPRVGDRVSAAGPVQRGTYGQAQIHALEFRTRAG
jgi:hypothetical protein